jgi:hypothetical protein
VAVYITGSGGTLATIYSDANRTALSNPFTAAADGSYFFYANDGRYDGTYSSGGIVTPFTTGDQTGIAYRKQAGTGAVDREYGDRIYENISVKDFGATGNGSTDDTAAVAASFTAAQAQGVNTVVFPAGAYSVSSITIPPSMRLTGAVPGSLTGGGTRINCTGSGTCVTLSDGGLGASSTSRSGGIDHVYIQCNSVAKIGLYMGVRVNDHCYDMIVDSCTTYNTVLDATQNSKLDGFENRNCAKCIGLVNGAANNYLDRIENTTASVTPMYLGLDATLPNASYAGAAFGALANTFVMNQFENGTFSTAINASTAYYNNLISPTAVDGGSATTLITFGAGASGNNTWGGYLATSRNIPIISNAAYSNTLNGPYINLLPGCTAAIVATSLLNIINPLVNDSCFMTPANWSISGAGQVQVTQSGPTLLTYTCSGGTCGMAVNPTLGSSTAQVQLNPMDNAGNRVSATYNCSWVTLGCWWTLPRTVGGDGYHWQNNTGTDLAFLDGAGGGWNLYSAIAAIEPVASSSTATLELVPRDNVGNQVDATYNCSWVTLGCWWVLPRTVSGDGYHWKNVAGTDLLFIDSVNGFPMTGTTVAPSVFSGFGTSPSITGTPAAGRVTVGSGGTASSGVIAWGGNWPHIPSCTANDETSLIPVYARPTVGALTLISSTPWGAGDTIAWVCLGGPTVP